MEAETVFVGVVSIIASLVGGYLAAYRMDKWLWSDGERYVIPILISMLSACFGSILGVLLFNAPLILLGASIWFGAIRYAIRRGLASNKRE